MTAKEIAEKIAFSGCTLPGDEIERMILRHMEDRLKAADLQLHELHEVAKQFNEAAERCGRGAAGRAQERYAEFMLKTTGGVKGGCCCSSLDAYERQCNYCEKKMQDGTNEACTCPETRLQGGEGAACPWCISQGNA